MENPNLKTIEKQRKVESAVMNYMLMLKRLQAFHMSSLYCHCYLQWSLPSELCKIMWQ